MIPKAKERFAEANQAYEIVGDKTRRKQFDARRNRRRRQAEIPAAFLAAAAGGDPFAGFRKPAAAVRAALNSRQSGGFGGAEDILKEMFGGGFGGAGAHADARNSLRRRT